MRAFLRNFDDTIAFARNFCENFKKQIFIKKKNSLQTNSSNKIKKRENSGSRLSPAYFLLINQNNSNYSKL